MKTPSRNFRTEPTRNADDGYGLVLAMVVSTVLAIVAAAAIQLTRTALRGTADQVARQRAFYVAEAGIQRGIAQLDFDRPVASTYTGYSFPSTTENFAEGSYVFTISQDPQFPTDPRRKLIDSTGNRARQSAQVAAHVFVQPLSSSVSAAPTPAFALSATPIPAGPPTPTFGIPPTVSPQGSPAATRTPGPAPTSTPGTLAGLPTATPTASGASPFSGVCDNHLLLASYNGTAKVITAAVSSSELFNGDIFSNQDVEFQMDAAVANNAMGTVWARRDFRNSGLAVNSFSSMTHATLYYGGSYQRAPLDGAAHGFGLCGSAPLFCHGAHFGGPSPQHGSPQAIPLARSWQPDFASLRRSATVIVNAQFQPFGTWDQASGTWVVSAYSFPAGARDLYYVEGNADLGSLSLLHTASPSIVARGWISVRSLTVAAAGLVSGDVQNVNLVAERDVVIGREVSQRLTPVFQSESVALSLSQGINLVNANHRLNVFAASARRSVWAMTSALSALSDTRACLLGNQDATVAFTGSVASTLRSFN